MAISTALLALVTPASITSGIVPLKAANATEPTISAMNMAFSNAGTSPAQCFLRKAQNWTLEAGGRYQAGDQGLVEGASSSRSRESTPASVSSFLAASQR